MFGDSLGRLVFWFKFRAHDFDITYLELRKKCFIWNEKKLLKNWKHPVLFLSQKDPKVTRNEVSISFCPQIFKKMTPLLVIIYHTLINVFEIHTLLFFCESIIFFKICLHNFQILISFNIRHRFL